MDEAGDTSYLNVPAMEALVAGMFSATREVARMVGEDKFSISLLGFPALLRLGALVSPLCRSHWLGRAEGTVVCRNQDIDKHLVNAPELGDDRGGSKDPERAEAERLPIIMVAAFRGSNGGSFANLTAVVQSWHNFYGPCVGLWAVKEPIPRPEFAAITTQPGRPLQDSGSVAATKTGLGSA